MTGNCLAASRPFLSFCPNFSNSGDMHWQLMKELLTGIFTVPNHHPKSQPFFDHVYTFSVVDYVTPCAKRSMLKKLQAGKYQQRLASKAAYEASRPTEPTYRVDETEEVFNTIEEEKENENTDNAPRKNFFKKK